MGGILTGSDRKCIQQQAWKHIHFHARLILCVLAGRTTACSRGSLLTVCRQKLGPEAERARQLIIQQGSLELSLPKSASLCGVHLWHLGCSYDDHDSAL